MTRMGTNGGAWADLLAHRKENRPVRATGFIRADSAHSWTCYSGLQVERRGVASLRTAMAIRSASSAIPAKPSDDGYGMGGAMISEACAACPLSCDQALAILQRELHARGLAQSHRVASLRGAPDITAEGAAFAAILLPRNPPRCLRGGECAGYKFLISQSGGVTCRSWRGRSARAA